MKERAEESERMREHVLKETDRNKDRMISLEEFLAQTKEDEFNGQDEKWETMDQGEDEFSEQEFKEFEARRQAEIQAMISQGLVPPGYPYYGDVPPGAIPHPGVVPPPHGAVPQYQAQAPHPGGQGQPVYNPNMQQGQPMHGSVPVQNVYNPNQPALNVQGGAQVQHAQPVQQNLQAAPAAQVVRQVPQQQGQNFPMNQQGQRAPIQQSGGPIQQPGQGQFQENQPPPQQVQQRQFANFPGEQPNVRQNEYPQQFQNQQPVQQQFQQNKIMNSRAQEPNKP